MISVLANVRAFKDWWAANHTQYLLGLARNKWPRQIIGAQMHLARVIPRSPRKAERSLDCFA
jgi:hypothetical protein